MLLLLGLAALAACAGGGSPSTEPGADSLGTFRVNGDPAMPNGAAWTFTGTLDGTRYDLAGVLYKPSGPGPFPAVLLNHGSDGSAPFFASLLAPTMVQWGLVCIAVNYTHSSGVPIGAPGDAGAPGASQANVQRAHMTHELLRRLGYVDMSRVAAHGHSMGAYLQVATAGTYPSDFRVASQTGGGVRPDFIVFGPAPSPSQARTIQTPFQMHHGDADATVPLSYDVRFDSLLSSIGVEHQLFVYPGEDHLATRLDATMLERVRAWYAAHGMF